jgi:hypothetical protein
VVLGVEFGHHGQAMFDQGFAACEDITLEHWQSRPISLRLKELLPRVWKYWL